VPHYFASDIHLRNDRPDRDRRFRAWLDRLTPDDSLLIVGDLCDFWMGSRRAHDDPLRSESLRALAEFRRQGGTLAVMAGNHDEWLCPFYAAELGATIVAEPHDMTVHGISLRIVHGHRLGARRAWKAWMEGRAFFEAFSYVPGPFAWALDQTLAWRNQVGLATDEERHLRVYRKYAEKLQGSADIVIFGHVHRPVDEAQANPRLIVLGGWQHRTSYLKIDARGATFHVEHDRDKDPPATALPRQPSLTHRGEFDEV
jgi:UDP-2,3-diacylglucosamine hydrolase